ncbi:MAG: MarR family transcriptional regulator [Lachnospiraceae bacterium]|nr:MarR family transcriptional regulator [Lachnospiraceae bacterium]
MEPTMFETAGAHFVDFTLTFFNLAKNIYRHENQIRANSLAFQVLLELNEHSSDSPAFTMSYLADCLRITKQQLTKLVNDLEDKQLVRRIHDTANRRQVYISITPEGRQLLNSLYRDMFKTTQQALSSYTEDEILELDQALVTMTRLLAKFDQNCI